MSAKTVTQRAALKAAPSHTGRGQRISALQRLGRCATSITDIATAVSPMTTVGIAKEQAFVKKEELVEAQLVIAVVVAGYGVRTPRATRMAMLVFAGSDIALTSIYGGKSPVKTKTPRIRCRFFLPSSSLACVVHCARSNALSASHIRRSD
jgi:hypothetical protein